MEVTNARNNLIDAQDSCVNICVMCRELMQILMGRANQSNAKISEQRFMLSQTLGGGGRCTEMGNVHLVIELHYLPCDLFDGCYYN